MEGKLFINGKEVGMAEGRIEGVVSGKQIQEFTKSWSGSCVAKCEKDQSLQDWDNCKCDVVIESNPLKPKRVPRKIKKESKRMADCLMMNRKFTNHEPIKIQRRCDKFVRRLERQRKLVIKNANVTYADGGISVQGEGRFNTGEFVISKEEMQKVIEHMFDIK